jgi:hypothetical protein
MGCFTQMTLFPLYEIKNGSGFLEDIEEINRSRAKIWKPGIFPAAAP